MHNAVLAYNAAYMLSGALSGAAMYVLARELTGRRDAAVIAGVVYAMQPFRASHLPHLQWLVTGWLPLSLWALHRYFRMPRPLTLAYRMEGFDGSRTTSSTTVATRPRLAARPEPPPSRLWKTP